MADHYFGLTDPGKERTNNEDTFIVQPSANRRFLIACVIDGVGGYSGGEVAAAIAREAILKRLERPAGEVIPILLDCFKVANQKILEAKKENTQHESMACVATLALVDLERNQLHYVHVGDTRMYLLRDHSLIKITHDQSFVGFLEESGRLSEDAAMSHPKRNEINKALGFDMNLATDDDYVETGQSPYLPGDMLLLCSDGLTDMVNKADISEIITQKNSLEQKCKNLVAAANHNGGKDNVTVVLVKNDKQASSYDATKPTSVQKKSELDIVIPPSTPQRSADQVTFNEAPKKRSTWPWVTAIILILIVGGGVWQYLTRQQPKPETIAQTSTQTAPAARSAGELETKLQTAIDSLKGNLLLINDSLYPSPIIISKAISIDKDSLFIKTKGKIILQADTGYTGPAIELSPRSKLVFIDSMTIRNFKTGIITYNNALTLKRVRFADCAVPVQNALNVPNNKPVSGTVSSLKADSTPAAPKRK